MGVPRPKLHGLTLPFLLFRMLTYYTYNSSLLFFSFHVTNSESSNYFPINVHNFYFFCFAIAVTPMDSACTPFVWKWLFSSPSRVWFEKNVHSWSSGRIAPIILYYYSERSFQFLHCGAHSLIRGVLIQSCSAGAKNLTNYVFCHVQFNSPGQSSKNHCAIKAKF